MKQTNITQKKSIVVNEQSQYKLEMIPISKSDKDVQQRLNLWKQFDHQNKGYIDIDQALELIKSIDSEIGQKIDKQVVQKALQQIKMALKTEDCSLKQNELRLFLLYLYKYLEQIKYLNEKCYNLQLDKNQYNNLRLEFRLQNEFEYFEMNDKNQIQFEQVFGDYIQSEFDKQVIIMNNFVQQYEQKQKNIEKQIQRLNEIDATQLVLENSKIFKPSPLKSPIKFNKIKNQSIDQKEILLEQKLNDVHQQNIQLKNEIKNIQKQIQIEKSNKLQI